MLCRRWDTAGSGGILEASRWVWVYMPHQASQQLRSGTHVRETLRSCAHTLLSHFLEMGNVSQHICCHLMVLNTSFVSAQRL